MVKPELHSGLKFGRLTVQGYEGKVGKHHKWVCDCDCGSTKSFYQSNLVGGKSTSCGCKSVATIEKLRICATSHGMSRTQTYKAWMGLKGRCNNEDYENYVNYGGRGIKVCHRWSESFENFYADMGEAPKGMSIDRKDNDGNYELKNCRWATTAEQQNNRRVTLRLSSLGKTMTLSEWSEETGLDSQLIRNRINLHGWSVDKALNTPRKTYRNSK